MSKSGSRTTTLNGEVTMRKADTSQGVSQVKGQSELPQPMTRRDVATAMAAALGASALSGCTSQAQVAEVDGLSEGLIGTAIRWVDTMAELRTIIGGRSVGIAILKGFWNAGDGGGGVFGWITPMQPDDGGTVIIPAGTTAGCWKRIYSDLVSVKWFGAKGDGRPVPGDTAAMQTAHNTGNVIYYPAGTYAFSKTIVLDKGGGIIGENRGNTFLSSTDSSDANAFEYTADIFNTKTSTSPVFRSFQLFGRAEKVKGSGIVISPKAPSDTELARAIVEDITVVGFPTAIAFFSAVYFAMKNCHILEYVNSGVLIADQKNPDGGDSLIYGNCVFSSARALLGPAIQYITSGGLKIEGNKFLSGKFAILLQLNGNIDTSDLLIVGNSIENQTYAGIALTRSSGAARFRNVVISGNQFANTPNGVVSTDTSAFLSNVMISGNVFDQMKGLATGVDLANIDGFTIGDNIFSSDGGLPTGIRISSTCSNGKIGVNTYKGPFDATLVMPTAIVSIRSIPGISD
jgi:hypothetical protein